MTVTEELEYVRRMLRLVAQSYPGQLPAEVGSWWVTEQQRIAIEEQRRAERKAAMIQTIEQKIAALNAELDRLRGSPP